MCVCVFFSSKNLGKKRVSTLFFVQEMSNSVVEILQTLRAVELRELKDI